MFGFGITKHKRKLSEAFEACFWPVMDQLGNVPIPMQSDPAINASILAVCASITALGKPSFSLNLVVLTCIYK